MIGDPIKIFRCSTSTPKIDIRNMRTNAEFGITRMSTLADVLGCRALHVRKLAIGWIYSVDMLNRGEASIPQLIHDQLGIDQSFIQLVSDCKDAYKNKGNIDFDKIRFRG